MDPRVRLAGWEAGPRAALGRAGGNQAGVGRRRIFAQPVPEQEHEGGLEGWTLPPVSKCPGCQRGCPPLMPRAGHSRSDSSAPLVPRAPREAPLVPQPGCGAQGPRDGVWLRHPFGPSAAHVPCPHDCTCPHDSARSQVCTSFCECMGSPRTRGFPPCPPMSPCIPLGGGGLAMGIGLVGSRVLPWGWSGAIPAAPRRWQLPRLCCDCGDEQLHPKPCWGNSR